MKALAYIDVALEYYIFTMYSIAKGHGQESIIFIFTSFIKNISLTTLARLSQGDMAPPFEFLHKQSSLLASLAQRKKPTRG